MSPIILLLNILVPFMNELVVVVTVYNLELMYFTSVSAPCDFLYSQLCLCWSVPFSSSFSEVLGSKPLVFMSENIYLLFHVNDTETGYNGPDSLFSLYNLKVLLTLCSLTRACNWLLFYFVQSLQSLSGEGWSLRSLLSHTRSRSRTHVHAVFCCLNLFSTLPL